jgi:diguanylate cyclase (GGDEF)-like protein
VSTVETSARESDPSEETLLRVVQILRGIAGTAAPAGDVDAIQAKLSDCVTSILEEVERRRAAPRSRLDAVTGLPIREQAEDAILNAYQAETPACVGVVAIDRLTTLNLRFGHEVGDQILRYYADALRQQLPSQDQIFRWSGPSLVALMLRPTRIEQVRREFGRLFDSQHEHTVQTASRAVHLPILPRWAVWPIMASPLLLIHKINSFASMQTRE